MEIWREEQKKTWLLRVLIRCCCICWLYSNSDYAYIPASFFSVLLLSTIIYNLSSICNCIDPLPCSQLRSLVGFKFFVLFHAFHFFVLSFNWFSPPTISIFAIFFFNSYALMMLTTVQILNVWTMVQISLSNLGILICIALRWNQLL